MSSQVAQISPGSVFIGVQEVSDKTAIMDSIRKEALSLVPPHHFYPAKFMIQLLDKYDADELRLILKDFQMLKESTFQKADKVQLYVVTAGGPGAGKSTYFEAYMKEQEVEFAYIDPDRSCLLHMENTYKNDLELGVRTAQEAYSHWREASNFLANVFLAHGLDHGYAVAHGSTMADPRSIDALKMIGGAYHYHRTLLHFTCEQGLRQLSEEKRREGGVVQCTDEDLVNKGKQFHERLAGYFAESEEIKFLYRTDMETVVEYGSRDNQKVVFTDENLQQKAANEHDAVCGEGDWKKVITQ